MIYNWPSLYHNIYIFSENYAQAKQCADINKIHPEDWTFLDNTDRLRGVARGQEVWYYGTPHERPDCAEIEWMIRSRNCIYIDAPSSDEHGIYTV